MVLSINLICYSDMTPMLQLCYMIQVADKAVERVHEKPVREKLNVGKRHPVVSNYSNSGKKSLDDLYMGQFKI